MLSIMFHHLAPQSKEELESLHLKQRVGVQNIQNISVM